jgi:hypothetical protein
MDAHLIDQRARLKHTVLGAMLIAAGLTLWFAGYSIWHVGELWPLLIVGIGVNGVLGACCLRQRRSGLWLLALGLWFALNQFTVLRYHDTWPLLLVAFGALIAWEGVAPAERCPRCKEGRHD